MPLLFTQNILAKTVTRGSNKMNERKYQSLRKKSISKGGMACIVMLMHTLSFSSLQMDLDVRVGDVNWKHSIVLKTTGGKGE